MIRLLIGFALVFVVVESIFVAQSTTPEPGEPPIAGLIDISEPDENGIVTIIGNTGSVFPTAQVSIRNMLTQETVLVRAGVTGSFSALITGSGTTPYWISPSPSIPDGSVDDDEALPGGPGTIVYGASTPQLGANTAVTPLLLDGQVEDWPANAALSDDTYALTNQDSLYLATSQSIEPAQSLVAIFTGEGVTYELSLQPALPQTAVVRQVAPRELDPAAVTAAVANDEFIELRVSLETITDVREGLTLNRIEVRSEEEIIDTETLDTAMPFRTDEQDGVVYADKRMDSFRRFSVSGALAQGAGFWTGEGRIDSLEHQSGETLRLELGVTLIVPELAESLSGLDLIGELGLQPVTLGEQQVAGLHTNNGWSNVLTPSGLAIDNLRGDVNLGRVRVPAAQIIRREDVLQAGFQFEVALPDELPDGIYVPTFNGRAQVGDGEIFDWEANGLFGTGDGIGRDAPVRLPLALNIGSVESPELLWTLFYDTFSDGSRGVIPEEVEGRAALSNRVRFNSERYILPPGQYPVEPYLLNILSNANDVTVPPLLPFLLPGGRISATITRPDGGIDQLADAAFIQNQLSSAVIDERLRSGNQAPMNAFRLTTGNPRYINYLFDTYGEYTIELNGLVEDIFGNRYTGGGTYKVFIAEPLDITPGVLSGTPLTQDDTLFAGGYIAPALPAKVDIDIQVYDIATGGMTTTSLEGVEANNRGYFVADDVSFDTSGEYIIDYTAQYEDADGRLWAGSLRSAGVIGSDEASLLAHGSRGIDAYTAQFPDDYRPSHYDTRQYPPTDLIEVDAILNYPYFAGDVALVPDSLSTGVHMALTVQDVSGEYATWLTGTVPDYVTDTGLPLSDLVLISELPVFPVVAGADVPFGTALRQDFIVGEGYSYFSATRPDVTVRQFVLGHNDDALPLYWDGSDPLNQQIGAGASGLQPGDYVFLFGGAVIKIPEINLSAAIPYASTAIVVDNGEAAGIYPAGHESTLLDIRGEALGSLFYPTGFVPGQIFTPGDSLNFAGQVAPAVTTDVYMRLVAPSGDEQIINGKTNPYGYFYLPDAEIMLEQAGVWTVEIVTTPLLNVDEAVTGGVPGAVNKTFEIYVVPSENVPLDWSLGGDVDDAFSPGMPFNIGLNIPADWTDVQIYHTVRTASYILEDGTLPRAGNTAPYQFNPARIAEAIPNFESSGAGKGASASDVVYITFAITGRDGGGRPDVRTRTLTLSHDRITSFDTLQGVKLE